MAHFENNKLNELKNNGTLNKSAGKVRSPLFTDNYFFDPHDLVQVKYEMLRAVEKDGINVSSASSEFGFSRVAYYKIKEELYKHGVKGLLPKKRGPQEARKLKQNDIEFIQQALNNDPKMTKKQLLEKLENERGIKVSKRTIERALSGKKNS